MNETHCFISTVPNTKAKQWLPKAVNGTIKGKGEQKECYCNIILLVDYHDGQIF